MFRGKESLNRIKLSRLVQNLLNFGVLGSLQLWGWRDGCMGVGGGWGVPTHMCTCMCMHTHAHTCTHMCVVNLIISCKWPPPLGESLGIPYDVLCMCACMCIHVHMCGSTLSPPHPHPPTPTPPGGTPGISQNSIALELIEIFQFRLKI